MFMSVHMSVHYVWPWCLQRPEGGVRTPGTGVIEG